MTKSYTRTYNAHGNLVAITPKQVTSEMATRGRRMYKQAQRTEDLKTVATTILSIAALVAFAYAFLLVA